MKDILCTVLGVLGSAVVSLFGGWDAAMGNLIAFIANETISIVENAGLMGVGIPEPILSAIDVLHNRVDGAGKK